MVEPLGSVNFCFIGNDDDHAELLGVPKEICETYEDVKKGGKVGCRNEYQRCADVHCYDCCVQARM